VNLEAVDQPVSTISIRYDTYLLIYHLLSDVSGSRIVCWQTGWRNDDVCAWISSSLWFNGYS